MIIIRMRSINQFAFPTPLLWAPYPVLGSCFLLLSPSIFRFCLFFRPSTRRTELELKQTESRYNYRQIRVDQIDRWVNRQIDGLDRYIIERQIIDKIELDQRQRQRKIKRNKDTRLDEPSYLSTTSARTRSLNTSASNLD